MAGKYASVHPGFTAGFQFIAQSLGRELKDGKHEIDGKRLFAICAHDLGRGKEASPLEFHRKYIDIQYVVDGCETIGWSDLASCQQIRDPYDPERDIGFYSDRPTSWFDVAPGSFAIFFPEDAHAPLAAHGAVHKIVVKVALDW